MFSCDYNEVMYFWKEMLCPFSRYIVSVCISNNVNLDHFVKVMSARVLHYKLILSLYLLSILGRYSEAVVG